MLKLEIGKTYRRADGEVRTIVGRTISPTWPFHDAFGNSYRIDGCWDTGKGHAFDLIEEVNDGREPAPIVFNEQSLLDAVSAKWGPAGAHVDVLRDLIHRAEENAPRASTPLPPGDPAALRAYFLRLVEAERARQDLTWGFPQDHSDAAWSAILGEECGEVCHAVNEGDEDNLDEELIQVAAVALSWLEHRHQGRSK